MLSFFRINDPYRLVFIFIIILLFRLPIFWGGIPMTVLELKWLLIGERLGSGHQMYLELWDTTGPLSALVYKYINIAFGSSQLSLQIVSLLLVTIQSYLFNNLLIVNKAFKENSYVPALVYAVLMSLTSDFYTLSPVMMSMTFVLISINKLFRRVEAKSSDETLHSIGLNLGIACLFYLPSIVFLFASLISLGIFTNTILRRYLLCVYGFLLPFLLASLAFYWFGSFSLFVDQYLHSLFTIESVSYSSMQLQLLVLFVPTFFTLWGLLKLLSARGFINYQTTLQQAVFIILVMSIIGWFLNADKSLIQLIILVIPVSFIICHFFTLNRTMTFWSELRFIVFILSIVFLNVSVLMRADILTKYIPIQKNLNTEQVALNKNKILVLSDDLSLYGGSDLATSFLNWRLSKVVFLKPDYYDNISLIYKNMINDLPEKIIDPSGVMPAIFDRVPALSLKYQLEQGTSDYLLVTSN